MEIEYAYFSDTPAFNYDKSGVQKHISDNAEKLLLAYEIKKKKCQKEYDDNWASILADERAFQTKTCRACNAKLRYISSYGFWGCPNYADRSKKHSSFNDGIGRTEPYVTISTHWVSEIIADCGLKELITAKSLIGWYNEQGLQDLRVLFGKGSAMNSINSYAKTKIKSARQEQEAYDLLKSIFPKVISQQCITFKIKGEKQSFCIPDFICGNPESVLVADAKLDMVNDNKMDLYIELVKHIVRSKNDKREVRGAHVMYDSPYKPTTKHQLYLL